jgi:hypothetical protein
MSTSSEIREVMVHAILEDGSSNIWTQFTKR